MKKLNLFFYYIFKKPWYFIISMFFGVIATLLFNAYPFFFAKLTELATEKDFQQLKLVAAIFILSILFSRLADAVNGYFANQSIVNTSTIILTDIMKKVHELDFAYHVKKSSGKLLSLINRGDDAVFSFAEALYYGFTELTIGLLLMFFSFAHLNIKYALLVLINFSVTSGLSYFILKANLKARSTFNEVDNKLTTSKVDNLINFETVKYFAQEKFEINRLKEVLGDWKNRLLKYFMSFRYFDLMIAITNTAFMAFILLLTISDLQNQTLTLANFVFIISFSSTLSRRIDFFINFVRHLARKNEDLVNYLSILEEKSVVVDPVVPQEIENLQGKIDFIKVDFQYENDRSMTLKDINMQIRPGEVIALVGYSGAGKTTIAKLLQRMYDVNQGEVLIDNINIKKMTRNYLRSLIGIVPQEPILFNNTVAYNIAYGMPNASESEIEKAAKFAQADDFVNKLEKKYQTVVGERGIKLSGGQKQRLAIARVLLKKPKILIFDEATSSLDSESEKAIQKAFWQYIRNKKQPVTTIIIAHRLSTIMQADRVLVMEEGKIIENDTHANLLKNKKSVYAHLWALQSNGFIGDGEREEK